MVVEPLTSKTSDLKLETDAEQAETVNWVGFAAGGTLIAGGLLLLAGLRRAGTVAATAGASLALLDHQETLRSWWYMLPGYLNEVERVLGQVQDVVDDVAEKRETLRRLLAR